MRRMCSFLLALILMLGLISCAQSTEAQWQEQYDLGVRYLSEGNYEEAIIAFTAAIEIDPMKADAYLSLAEVFMVDDSAEEAANILKRGYEATGEVYFIEKIKEAENAQLPVLTEAKMNDFIWAYSLLEAEDYSTLCREGDQMYADRQYAFPFDEYIGLCFDGTRLYRYFDGVGLKIIDRRHWYFGELVAGKPEGKGVSYCYRPQADSHGALFYELYEGEWAGGLPNGDGIFTNMLGNVTGNQCRHTYEGVWMNNTIDGEVVEKNYIDDVLETEYHYACILGYYVLDERWTEKDSGGYVLLPEYSIYNAAKSYQEDRYIAILDE